MLVNIDRLDLGVLHSVSLMQVEASLVSLASTPRRGWWMTNNLYLDRFDFPKLQLLPLALLYKGEPDLVEN